MGCRKKVESAAMSIRFSGKQDLDLHQSIANIVEQTGKSENTVMKYLMQIGLAWYQKGSVAGIDGTVILRNDTEVGPAPTTQVETVPIIRPNDEEMAPPVKEKKSSFLD